MKPGREMDALVAERVMGWRVMAEYEPGVIKCLVDGNQCEVNPPEFPRYSTDIAAAWEVVMELLHRGFSTAIESEDRGAHWFRISGGEAPEGPCYLPNGEVCCSSLVSAPHAICLAALKAVGVEV